MPTLEERILQLEEIEAIRRLKNVYAAHCDNNYDPDALAPMFTEDAVWEMGPLGRFEGRQQIKNFFTEVSGKFTFALHYMCGHMIDFVSPTEATGTWYIWETATIDGVPMFVAATYEDRYVKQDGEWKFARVKVNPAFMTPYHDGWVKTQFPPD